MTQTDGDQALRSELRTLREDLAKIQTDLRGLAQTMMDASKQQAKETGQRINEQVHSGMESAQEYIEKRPITTMAVAFATGMMLGRILGRE